jgi:RNase P/RNase MRP subunit p29
MKTWLFIITLLVITTLSVFAQTNQDTTIVTIETHNGGKFSGHILSETGDSIKIETRDLGIITIAKKEMVRYNLYTIETTDGNEFLGEIMSEDSLTLKLKTDKFGEIIISKKDIKKKESVEVQSFKQGKYWFPNPQSTRYFWAPNGYGLKKGEGYYQNIWVLWNQFTYGVTDYFSIGAGIIPTFLFGAPTPIFATMKFSIPIKKDKFNLAGGAIAGYVLGETDAGLGILYGVATYGSHDSNISFGMGYGFAGGEWAKAPMMNLNGMFRVSSRGYFITENYVIVSDGKAIVMLSAGGRSIIKKAALDYGLIIPFVDGSVEFAIPWLGFTVPFGKKN